jgi:hypothetical protein
VTGVPFQSLIKSYLVAAIGSGSDSPARTISGSSWRRYDWRLYDTTRTDDHLARAAGNHRTGSRRTVGPSDCSYARLLGLDGAQMAPPWSTQGCTGLSSHYRTAQYSSGSYARCHLAHAPDASWLGAGYTARLNYELIDAGQINPCQVDLESRRCSKPPNSRVAIRSIVNCPPYRSSRRGHRMTSGNSMPKTACT